MEVFEAQGWHSDEYFAVILGRRVAMIRCQTVNSALQKRLSYF